MDDREWYESGGGKEGRLEISVSFLTISILHLHGRPHSNPFFHMFFFTLLPFRKRNTRKPYTLSPMCYCSICCMYLQYESEKKT